MMYSGLVKIATSIIGVKGKKVINRQFIITGTLIKKKKKFNTLFLMNNLIAYFRKLINSCFNYFD